MGPCTLYAERTTLSAPDRREGADTLAFVPFVPHTADIGSLTLLTLFPYTLRVSIQARVSGWSLLGRAPLASDPRAIYHRAKVFYPAVRSPVANALLLGRNVRMRRRKINSHKQCIFHKYH